MLRLKGLVFLFTVLAVLAWTAPVQARGRIQGYAQRGSPKLMNSILGTGVTAIQSYPGANVTFYISGTLTKATIYGSQTGPSIGNPTRADSTAYFFAYLDDGNYDIQISGAGLTTPFMWATDLRLVGGSIFASVRDFGAKCDNATNDLVAIQAAVDSGGGTTNVTLSVPVATCMVTSSILVRFDRVRIAGAGPHVSQFRFVPSSNNLPVFWFANVSGEQFQTALTGVGFASLDTTNTKIAIRIGDVGQVVLQDIAIGPIGAWTGGNSIGLQLRGREEGIVDRVEIAADRPIVVEKNANSGSGVTIDLDHWHFSNMNLIANANPCFEILDGVYLTNFLLDGYEGFNRGTHGFYYNDTSSVLVGAVANINNIRWEQGTSATGYAVFFHANTTFRNLNINSCQTGQGNRGFLVQGVTHLTVMNSEFNGTSGEALNIAGDEMVLLSNNFWNASSTFTTTGMTRVIAYGLLPSQPAPGLAVEFWISSANPQGVAAAQVNMNGVQHYSTTNTIAAAAIQQFTAITTATARGHISVVFSGLGGDGGCTVALTPNGTFNESNASPSTCSAGNVAGKFSVLFSGPAAINVVNNLPNTVTYTITADWIP